MPQGLENRARARWLEEFADTRMGEVFIWHYFQQLVMKKSLWGETRDEAKLKKAKEEEIPDILDYMEKELPKTAFLFGENMHMADISIAAFFRNLAMGRYTVDAARWPVTSAYIERALAQPSFQKLKPFEDIVLKTPLTGQNAAFKAANAPLVAVSLGTLTTPRRGIMDI